jgi:NADH:ubiquinone oxidoreductase subunit C
MQEWQEKIEQEVGQLKEEVRQLREQRTEEMKAINVNVASADVLNQLQELRQNQTEIFNVLVKTVEDNTKDLATKEDIEKRFDAIAEVQKQILDRLPPKSE